MAPDSLLQPDQNSGGRRLTHNPLYRCAESKMIEDVKINYLPTFATRSSSSSSFYLMAGGI